MNLVVVETSWRPHFPSQSFLTHASVHVQINPGLFFVLSVRWVRDESSALLSCQQCLPLKLHPLWNERSLPSLLWSGAWPFPELHPLWSRLRLPLHAQRTPLPFHLHPLQSICRALSRLWEWLDKWAPVRDSWPRSVKEHLWGKCRHLTAAIRMCENGIGQWAGHFSRHGQCLTSWPSKGRVSGFCPHKMDYSKGYQTLSDVLPCYS